MIIQHNIPALNSHRNMGINNANTSKNLEKLSSGYRINRAGDDAAGLAISEKMRGQIRGLAMAEQNTSNGISLIQTAEGGLNETHAILQRMRELAVQSANGTFQNEDRKQIALEVNALKSEIDRISSATHYNQINLLDGSLGGISAEGASATGTQAQKDAATALGLMGLANTVQFTVTSADHKNLFDGQTATINVHSDGATATSMSIVVGDKTYMVALTADDFGTGATLSDGTTSIAAKDVVEMTNDGYVKVGTIDALPTAATKVSGTLSKLEFASGGGTTVTLANSKTAIVATESSQLIFQIGANGGLDQRVGLHVENMSTGNLGIHKQAGVTNKAGNIAGISILTREQANEAIEVLDAATNQVSAQRADLGALQNRLEHTLNNLGVTKENLTAAESTIRDVDMAKEMMEFTKNNILVQASQAMLAQANALPQGVLSLLR